jgi:hypothetical protein
MTAKNYPKWYKVLATTFEISEDSVSIVVEAILRGRGEKARFNIPELEGQGIWKQKHGAVMGNGFDDALNEKATELCIAIQAALTSEANRTTLEFSRVTDTTDMMSVSIEASEDGANWLPKEFGEADVKGETGTLRYAYFASHNRLVVQTSQRTRFFDTSGFEFHSLSNAGEADFMSALVKTDVGEFPLSKLKEIL